MTGVCGGTWPGRKSTGGQPRREISSTPFLRAEKLGVRVTASFGLATFVAAAAKTQLLMAADRYLLGTKETGKNRVSLRPQLVVT
jgi:PleD family two-component response regulator